MHRVSFVSAIPVLPHYRPHSSVRPRISPRAQLGDGKEIKRPEDLNIFEEASKQRAGRDPAERFRQLVNQEQSVPEIPEETDVARDILEAGSGLAYLFTVVPGRLNTRFENYLSNPFQLLLSSALSILFGFFASTSASTIIGSVADWDPLAALVLLLITESFTRWYYGSELRHKSRLLQLVNAFKIGLILGMTVDAFKLST